jgi:hypothetical protein
MTDMPQPDQTEPDSPFAKVVKTGALVATATWLLVVFSFVAALHGTSQPDGFNALGPLLALVVMTPIFFIFVLPALLFSFLGGKSGAKAGAAMLIGGLAVGLFTVGMPLLR